MLSTAVLRRAVDAMVRQPRWPLCQTPFLCPSAQKSRKPSKPPLFTLVLSAARVLSGLPHPSGANAERIAFFLGRKKREDVSSKVDADRFAVVPRIIGSQDRIVGIKAP